SHQGEAGQGPGAGGHGHDVQHRETHERTGHEHAEVGEVDELDDAVDHREAEGEEGVHHAERQAVENLLEYDVEQAHDDEALRPAPRTGGITADPADRITTPL